MIAFLTRRKDTPVDTPAATEQTTQAPDTVVMRFRTQGGATIDLYPITWTIRGHVAEDPIGYRGFQWICRGCDTAGRDHQLGWGYSEAKPHNSRREANEHAIDCHAMPKHTA